MKSSTDIDQLLQRCRDGNADAMEWLYSHYHKRLLGISQRYVSDIEAARDIEHDAWIMILTSFNSLQDNSKLEAWMGSIVRNMALNYLKQDKSHQQIPIDDTSNLITDNADEPQPTIPIPIIMEMVKSLPQGYERVFRLKAFEGRSHRQIGEILGITEGSSRSQLSRAKQLLKEMAKRYWALAIILVLTLIPTILLLIDNKPETVKTPSSPSSKVSSALTPDEEIIQVKKAVESLASSSNDARWTSGSTHISQAVTSDTIDNDLVAPARLNAIIERGALITVGNPPALSHTPSVSMQSIKQPQLANKLNKRHPMLLANSDILGSATKVTDNFLSVINFAGGETKRSMRLYTWQDYYSYVDENSSFMDSIDAKNMKAIANRHKENDSQSSVPEKDNTPLQETKRHEHPVTFQLSVNIPLYKRFSMSSGLGYTYMKSVFETDNGNNNDITRRTQRLHYLTVPLGVNYTLWQHKRWTAYASGNIRLDIPLRGKETTQYIYVGPYSHAPGDSLVFNTTSAQVKAPWQWSVGCGIGIQYRLLPNVNAFFEPNIRYYIPTGSPVETYRTVHPFNVAIPFGIRIVP